VVKYYIKLDDSRAYYAALMLILTTDRAILSNPGKTR
jgi:hypothetical protein